jgi:hypothetical protein
MQCNAFFFFFFQPIHSSQIQKFKGAICKNTVDSTGLATIQSVMDALIADACPMVLPGELPQGPTPPNQLRVRESAQAILADLWMIGQRFKSVSQSHVEVRLGKKYFKALLKCHTHEDLTTITPITTKKISRTLGCMYHRLQG